VFPRAEKLLKNVQEQEKLLALARLSQCLGLCASGEDLHCKDVSGNAPAHPEPLQGRGLGL